MHIICPPNTFQSLLHVKPEGEGMIEIRMQGNHNVSTIFVMLLTCELCAMEKLIQHSKSDGSTFFINLVVKIDCPLTRQRNNCAL
jgi:hypothetical protein